jgi:hypothetical protein
MANRRRAARAHPLNAFPAIAVVAGLAEALAVWWPTYITLAIIAAALAYWVAGMIREPKLAKETECLVIGALVAGAAVWLAPAWLGLIAAAVLVTRSCEAQHAVRGGVAIWWPFSNRMHGVKAPARETVARPAVPLPRRSPRELVADAANRLPGTTRALLKQVSGECLADECDSCEGTGCAHGCGHAAAARRKRSTREQARRAVGAGAPGRGYSFADAVGRDTPPF